MGPEKTCFYLYSNDICLGLHGDGQYRYCCRLIFFSHSTNIWIESLLQNHRFKKKNNSVLSILINIAPQLS